MAAPLFEPLIVQHKTFEYEFFQRIRCPDAKLGGLIGIDAVADRDDDIQIIESDRLGRMSKVHFLHIALFIQFPALKDVLQMPGDNASIPSKEIGKLLLCQPDCFALNNDANFDHAIPGSVKDKVV